MNSIRDDVKDAIAECLAEAYRSTPDRIMLRNPELIGDLADAVFDALMINELFQDKTREEIMICVRERERKD